MKENLHRIAIGTKLKYPDPKGYRLLNSAKEDLNLNLKRIRTVQIYDLEMSLSLNEKKTLVKELFCDPVTEYEIIQLNQLPSFDYLVEVGLKPGVTDNVASSALSGVADVLCRKLSDKEKIYTAHQYLIKGKGLTKSQCLMLAEKLLANELIHNIDVKSFKALLKLKLWNPAKSNSVSPNLGGQVEEIPLATCSNKALMDLSQNRLLALNLKEMQAIKRFYQKPSTQKMRIELGLPLDPTDIELECLAQTWSEHCKHKIFAATIYYENGKERKTVHSLFKSYIKKVTDNLMPKKTWLQSVFTDNAGLIRFDKDYSIAMKVETHNSPSALDPYGGAMTGIVGVNRDILGTGLCARPIFNTDVFCFALPNYKGKLPGKLMHPKRIFRGVHQGVKDGGNQSGIPTINGSMVFDNRFLGKPLVFCGTGGIIPSKLHGKNSALKRLKKGDLIVMVGGRIGKDGIHGATFSSARLLDTSPTSAVQIGDPITQKMQATKPYWPVAVFGID